MSIVSTNGEAGHAETIRGRGPQAWKPLPLARWGSDASKGKGATEADNGDAARHAGANDEGRRGDSLDPIRPGLSRLKAERLAQEAVAALAASGLGEGEEEAEAAVARLCEKLVQCGYDPQDEGHYLTLYQEARAQAATGTTSAGASEAALAGPRYVRLSTASPEEQELAGACGIVDRRRGNRLVANFEPVVEQDLEVEDDVEGQAVFVGTVRLEGGAERPFRVSADHYADDGRLKAALYRACGSGIRIDCRMAELRNAIAEVSVGRVTRRTTTNFGWTPDQAAYMTPCGRVTADGFEEPAEGQARVDLSGEQAGVAGRLELKPLGPQELERLKRHVVEDLLGVQCREVTYSLLGTAAAAVLYPFAPPELGRYDLWLVGLTGSGKSFVAKLFQNFFGDFLASRGGFATWGATPNYLQGQGYYFKDALYLVDDYKPQGVCPRQVITLLQTYADNTARGRLNADARARALRPIRGFLVSTGEDVPEHSASTTARSITVEVPNAAKDVERGEACMRECGGYSGVTADFVRWLLAQGRLPRLQARVRRLKRFYLRGIAGQQNDTRVAGNLALLAAGFREMARYLADVWPGWRDEARRFVRQDLVGVRDRMLGMAKGQQESEVFLETLADLVQNGRVQVVGHPGAYASNGLPADSRAPVVGKSETCARTQRRVWKVSVAMALGEVQQSLRNQGRPPLRSTRDGLLGQLLQDGRLLDADGNRLEPGKGEATQRVRLGGQRERCVVLDPAEIGACKQPEPRPPLGPRKAVMSGGSAEGDLPCKAAVNGQVDQYAGGGVMKAVPTEGPLGQAGTDCGTP